MRSRKVKKGSALVMVLIIFMVVSITGMALLGTALQNYTNMSVTAKSKFNLYMSSSGIDEAYAVINKYVEEAIKYSNIETDKDIEKIINKDKESLDKLFQLSNVSDKTEIEKAEINTLKNNLFFYDESGSIKGIKLKEEQNKVFKSNFYGYFASVDTTLKIKNDNNVVSNITIDHKGNIEKLIDNIESKDYELSSGGKNSKIEVQVQNSNILKDALKESKAKEKFQLSLVSNFNQNGIEKKIMAEVEVNSPDYDSNNAISSSYINLLKNPVWSKPIMVGKNLELKGGDLEAEGGIYVNGTEKQKGIVITDKNSSLKINGDLITAQSLIFNYDNNNTNGSNVEIEGNAYVRNLITEKDEASHSYGAEGTKVNIKKSKDGTKGGSLYVLDDMEINANKSIIDIEGSYYGASDGSDSENNKVDHSSAININCDDLGNGTSLKIGENIYLGGTAYITGLKDPYGTGEYKYQTGESIAIKGNYKAYSKKLEPNKPDKDRTISAGDGTEKNLKNDVQFRHFDPLKLVSDYNTNKAWWNLKENHGEYKLTVGLTYNGKIQFPTAYKFTAFLQNQKEKTALNDKSIIGEGFEITSDDAKKLLDSKNEVIIEVYDKDQSKLGANVEILAQKIDEEVEGFIYTNKDNKKSIIIDMTPYGELINQEAAYYRLNIDGINNEAVIIGEYIEIPKEASINKNDVLTVEILDIDKSLLKNNLSVELKDLKLDNLNVYAKSKYFKYYAEDYEDDINKGSGIQIGYKLDSSKRDFLYTGIIFNNNTLLDNTYLSDTGELIKNDYKLRIKKLQLKDKLFYMDFLEKNMRKSEEIEDTENITSEEQYKQFIKKIDTGYDEKILNSYISVHELIDFTKDSINETNNEKNIVIFDGNENDSYAIIGSGAKGTVRENKKVNLQKGKGIIITKGDIHIYGNMEFEGVIITAGNIYMEEGASLDISYKDKVVEGLVARNYDKLKDIFRIKNTFALEGKKVDIYDIDNTNNKKIKPVVIKKWGIVK